jgi:hypothetical protein
MTPAYPERWIKLIENRSFDLLVRVGEKWLPAVRWEYYYKQMYRTGWKEDRTR